MSHLTKRKEKDCLNCGTAVVGNYCHNCGQENIEPKESVGHFVAHFFNDVTHFDGKFFTTLKDLLFRPGFLSREYMAGRRMKYLNPVRMYLFTSFLFFLIFFSVFHFTDSSTEDVNFTFRGRTEQMIDSMSAGDFNKMTMAINNGVPMSRDEFRKYYDSSKSHTQFQVFGSNPGEFGTLGRYDSAVHAGTVKDGWLKRIITRRQIELNTKYGDRRSTFFSDFVNSLMHHFPQILFLSLPFAALLLKLLYIRRRQFYFVSHAIFSIHFYIFTFIAMLLMMGVSGLTGTLHWSWLGLVNGLLGFSIFFYLYKAMRNFYMQRRAKTVLKYLLFSISFFFIIVFLFVIFAFVSIFQV
jgi:hypothetical protein